jgi:hypothetical protein
MSRRIEVCAVAVWTIFFTGCGSSQDEAVPSDLKLRIPSVSTLKFFPALKRGADESASAKVVDTINLLSKQLRPLDDLNGYLENGGVRQRNVSIVVTLENPPHVADQLVRYTRGSSRLDVERVGDHAFFYLQYDQGDGFDPDSAIGPTRMLVDGGSLRAKTVGVRPNTRSATGLASANRGYMRVHLDHHPSDFDSVYKTVHIDYSLDQPAAKEEDPNTDWVHFVHTIDDKVSAEDGQLWAVQRLSDSEGGTIVASEAKKSGQSFKAAWAFLAQYKKDGSLAVWKSDGTLWACYSGGGTLLGDTDSPEGCADFTRKFTAPPKSSVWPGGLPGGVPR